MLFLLTSYTRLLRVPRVIIHGSIAKMAEAVFAAFGAHRGNDPWR